MVNELDRFFKIVTLILCGSAFGLAADVFLNFVVVCEFFLLEPVAVLTFNFAVVVINLAFVLRGDLFFLLTSL